MKSTEALRRMGQSIWLDNFTRRMLDDGTLLRYLAEMSVTGVTSTPASYTHAIGNTRLYDDGIHKANRLAISNEDLFLELAVDDLTRAADVLRPVHDATGGEEGWVSLDVPPALAGDACTTLCRAIGLHKRANRRNLLVKMPGTCEGLAAIEEAIFAGVAVDVTLLFSPAQYLAAAASYMRGVERRIAAGLDPVVRSVASMSVGRWDKAVAGRVPVGLRNLLGLTVAREVYRASRELLASAEWAALAAAGAVPQRLLFARTGADDSRDVLYVEGLVAPDTIDAMPETTLVRFADHGAPLTTIPDDGGYGPYMLERFAEANVKVDALAAALQRDGVAAFDTSWDELLECIAAKRDELAAGGVL